MNTVHVVLTGRVQGVFMRSFIKGYADKMGLTGTVNNLSDGSVETFIQGDEEAIKEALRLIEQGTSYAEIDSVQVEWIDTDDVFDTFSIIRGSS